MSLNQIRNAQRKAARVSTSTTAVPIEAADPDVIVDDVKPSAYVRGDVKTSEFAVDSATVIAVGDLLYLDTDDVKPFASLSDVGSLVGNQEAVHDAFAGVALEDSAAGETAAIQVALSGVFQFTQGSATNEVGGLIGAQENGAGDELLNDTVVAVAAPNLSIGRVADRNASAATTVNVDIVSTVIDGGEQAVA